MTKKELKAKISDIIDRKTIGYEHFMKINDKCLQTKEIMSRIDAELVAFNSVLDALNNNNTMINCY